MSVTVTDVMTSISQADEGALDQFVRSSTAPRRRRGRTRGGDVVGIHGVKPAYLALRSRTCPQPPGSAVRDRFGDGQVEGGFGCAGSGSRKAIAAWTLLDSGWELVGNKTSAEVLRAGGPVPAARG